MKAYNLHGIDDLRYEEIEIPKLKKGWVLVKVKAAGICSSDIPRIFTKGTYHFPTIPGHEFCGVVKEVYDEDDKELIDKRVGIFPLIPCRECESCGKHQYEMCDNYNYLGSRCDGGFAEYIAVPKWNLIELPEKISFIEGAMFEPLAVALHCTKKAEIQTGESVAIIGTGMIGISAAQWAKKFGASKITVYGRSESKRRIIDDMDGISYEIINNKKISLYDKVIEAVGSNDSISYAIESTKPGGKIVLLGNPYEDLELNKDTYWRILRKQLKVEGTWNSSYENNENCDWQEVREALDNNQIDAAKLVSHVFDSSDLKKGLSIMKNKTEPYCKVMIEWK